MNIFWRNDVLMSIFIYEENRIVNQQLKNTNIYVYPFLLFCTNHYNNVIARTFSYMNTFTNTITPCIVNLINKDCARIDYNGLMYSAIG